LSFIVRVLPIYRFAIWGSDSGEYYLLTRHLTDQGLLLIEGYLGFGFTYPYFQGFELWAGTLSIVTGTKLAGCVWLAGPLTGWLAAPLVALLALHLLDNNRLAAIIASGVVAVALPHVVATSHPMPGTAGETLALTCLLLHLKALERPRWYLPLVPVTLALIATHHFSLYFYLLGAFGAWVFYCLGLPIKEREAPTIKGVIWFSGVALLAAFYWMVYAEPFGNRILAIQPGPTVMLFVAPLTGLTLVAFLMTRWQGRLVISPKLDSPRVAGLKLGAFAIGALALTLLVALKGVPGTTIVVPVEVFVFLLPLVGLLALTAFPGVLPTYQRGGLLLGWLSLPLVSFAVAAASNSHELISYRHLPYLMESLAVLAGAGGVLLLALMEPRSRSRSSPGPLRRLGARSIMAMTIGGLILAAALTAYPPPELFGGFQEGTNPRELDLVLWARDGLEGPHDPTEVGPRTVTDHRLSSMLFGLAGATPTWDLAGGLLHSEVLKGGQDELRVKTPEAGSGPAAYVALSDEVRDHAALAQWEVAEGLSEPAQAKFEQAPFVRLYDNGRTQVYIVDNWLVP